MSSPAPASPPVPYRERLWPAPWVWFAALATAATSGLVVLGPLGGVVAAVVAIAAVTVTGVALVGSSALVEVADGHLRAGRARVPIGVLGRVRVVDESRMRALRGPEADPRAYLCQRGWLGRGVVVEVVDANDPTPYWLLSSRTPERLAAALEGARGEPPSGRPGQEHSRHTG